MARMVSCMERASCMDQSSLTRATYGVLHGTHTLHDAILWYFLCGALVVATANLA